MSCDLKLHCRWGLSRVFPLRAEESICARTRWFGRKCTRARGVCIVEVAFRGAAVEDRTFDIATALLSIGLNTCNQLIVGRLAYSDALDIGRIYPLQLGLRGVDPN